MSVPLCRRLLRVHILPVSLLRTLSTTTSTFARRPRLSSSSSFTVDFLTTSCGLTPAQAVTVARTVHFGEKTRQQPESVLAVLRSHGFSDAQITEAVVRMPRILCSRAQKKLGPKLQFLTKAGITAASIAKAPYILSRGLDLHIRPCIEFLRCFLDSAEDLRTIFVRHNRILAFMKGTIKPNVHLLLEKGVAAPAVSKLIRTSPRTLTANHERFAEVIKMVQGWGLKPDRGLFLHAVRAVSGLSKSTLAAKLELFKNLGWSGEEVISALRRAPLCILVSEQKLIHMNSFYRKLDLGPSDLSRMPQLLKHGFDKRILPRYAVWWVLRSKGLIKQKNDKLISVFCKSEKRFLDRYLTRYIDKVPELRDVYLGKITVEGFDVDGEESRDRQKF